MTHTPPVLIPADEQLRAGELDPLREGTVALGPCCLDAGSLLVIHEEALDRLCPVVAAFQPEEVLTVVRGVDVQVERQPVPISEFPEVLVYALPKRWCGQVAIEKVSRRHTARGQA